VCPGSPAEPTAIHLRPTAPLAERVLLPGDPGRALALAQSLLTEPRMFNHHRGLWGYTGPAQDGRPLTIQATGMGGPSAAIVLTELIALGARTAIRVGTCGALDGSLQLGDLVVAREALCADGASRALGASERAPADAGLMRALERCLPDARTGTIASVDLFYDPPGQERGGAGATSHELAARALAIEMETATLFTIGARAGIGVGCVLAVSDTFSPQGERRRISDEDLLAAAQRMGAGAACALAE
jgi:uridine phosphorylase